MNILLSHPTARVPEYSTPGAACFDLYSVEFGVLDNIVPSRTFDTGLRVEVPEGQALLIFSRSGHGFNHNVRLANCTGVIDSDYRGTIKVKLIADGGHALRIMPGDRIAQGLLLPCQQIAFNVVQELSATERGEGGFGSTGR